MLNNGLIAFVVRVGMKHARTVSKQAMTAISARQKKQAEILGGRPEFACARDMMFEYTDTQHSPWYVVESNDKKKARLNIISHILAHIPYKKVDHEKIKLGDRSMKGKYDDSEAMRRRRYVESKF